MDYLPSVRTKRKREIPNVKRERRNSLRRQRICWPLKIWTKCLNSEEAKIWKSKEDDVVGGMIEKQNAQLVRELQVAEEAFKQNLIINIS